MIGAAIALLILKIAFSSTRIPESSGESEAIAEMAARMADLAQWTISTVLLVGGLLVGLNWYQSERRYEHDRSTVQDELAVMSERITSLQQNLHLQTSLFVIQRIEQELDDLGPLRGPSRLQQIFNESTAENRWAVISVMLRRAEKARDSHLTAPMRGYLETIHAMIPAVRLLSPDSADRLAVLCRPQTATAESTSGRKG